MAKSAIPVMLLLALRAAVWGADAPGNGNGGLPTGKYAVQVADFRATAVRVREQAASLEGEFQRFIAFARADLPAFHKAAEAEAAAYEDLARAYQAEDLQRVPEIRARIDRAHRVYLLWRERIYEYRKKQGEAAPSEAWFADESRWFPAGAMPELLALDRARRTASQAWRKVAEAIQPELAADDENGGNNGRPDREMLEDLREQAFSASLEREVADMRLEWAIQREKIWTDKKVQSPEIDKTLESLRQAQERRVQLRRDEAARQRSDRRVERDIRQAEHAFRKAYEAAEKEKNKK